MAKLWRALLGRDQEISRYSIDQYVTDLSLAYNGSRYLLTGGTTGYTKTEDIEASFTGYISSMYKSNGIVFAIVLARMLLFTEGRFCWWDVGDNGEDGKASGRAGLEVLERPWPNAGTGELLARMEQDVSLGGNFYAVREFDRLRRLRPDWVTIVLTAPPAEATESDVAGYWYHPGRTYSNVGEPAPGDQVYLPDEICHFSPVPDPEAQYRGMSWLTPVVREVMADKAATQHKLNFFDNGATLGAIVSAKENLTETQFKEWEKNLSAQTTGVSNAYRSLFLASPIDVNIRTADMKQLDFKLTQGAGETRLCSVGGVPPIIVGLSEGLASATYSNYGMARRKFGDGWARPQWKFASTALSTVVESPAPDLRLGVNVKDIAFLREDRKDQVEITRTQILALESGIRAGYKSDALVDAIAADDITLLKGQHTGLTSVQLLPPGAKDTDGDGSVDMTAEDVEAEDEYAAALESLRAEVVEGDIERRYYGAGAGERNPLGSVGGGRFRKLSDQIIDAIEAWLKGDGDGDPLEKFTQPQLRKAAKDRGLVKDRERVGAAQLKLRLLNDARGKDRDESEKPEKAPAKPDVADSDEDGSAKPAKATPAPTSRPDSPKANSQATPPAATARDDPTEALRDELDLKKVAELKAEIRRLNEQRKAQGLSPLPLSGKKRDLVDRIVEAQAPGKKGEAPSTPAADVRPGPPEGAKKLTKAITGGPEVYEVEVAPYLHGVTTQKSGTAGFLTVQYRFTDKGDIKQASDGSWQVWQNQAGIELGTRYDTEEAAAQAVAIGTVPAWLLPRKSFNLYDGDGNKIGGWDQHGGWKSARGMDGRPINLGTSRSTKTGAVTAVLAHNERQKQLAAAREAASAAAKNRLARAAEADAKIASAQAVLYGSDPQATSPTRQLQVYGALEPQDFQRMDPGEQSALLADLAHIATSDDRKQATRARQMIGWFTPAGTPAGMVTRPSAQAGIGPANGTQDRFSTAQVGLAILPDGDRGQSGDGWFTGTAGSTRWGEYGAAGVLLRHVDDDGTERFLMVQRGPGVSDPGVWSFPGGAKDENETFLQGGARELVEEMGLSEDVLSSARVYGTHTSEAPDLMVPSAGGGTESWKYVSIAADVDDQLQIDLTGEHTWETSDARWLTRDEIADLDNRGKLHRPVAGGALQQNVMSLFPATDRADRIAPAEGQQPARLAGVPARPRPVVSDFTADEGAMQDLAARVADTQGTYAGKTADSRLAAIGAVQGYDATPTVVTSGQVDDLLATGDYVEVWRGVTDSTVWDDDDDGDGSLVTAAQVQEQLRSGPAFYGTGIYGNGFYFAEERAVAEGYAGSDGALVRALIPRSALVPTMPDVEEDMERAGARRLGLFGGLGNAGGDDDPIGGDQGRFAAARGWDGIRIDGYSARPIYNIVNRSVLIVEDANQASSVKSIPTTDVRAGMIIRLSGTTQQVTVTSVSRGTAADTGEDVIIVTTTDGRELYLSLTGTTQQVGTSAFWTA